MGPGSPPVSPNHVQYSSVFRPSLLLARILVPRPSYRQVQQDLILQSRLQVPEAREGSEISSTREEETADEVD